MIQISVTIPVLQMRQGHLHLGLGEEMHLAHKSGDKMPEAVEFDDDDSAVLRSIKRLIVEMTSYHASDRPAAAEILQRIAAISMEARLSVVPYYYY